MILIPVDALVSCNVSEDQMLLSMMSEDV